MVMSGHARRRPRHGRPAAEPSSPSPRPVARTSVSPGRGTGQAPLGVTTNGRLVGQNGQMPGSQDSARRGSLPATWFGLAGAVITMAALIEVVLRSRADPHIEP